MKRHGVRDKRIKKAMRPRTRDENAGREHGDEISERRSNLTDNTYVMTARETGSEKENKPKAKRYEVSHARYMMREAR